MAGRYSRFLLSNINTKITDANSNTITAEITHYDIVEGVKRCPKQSSPGKDRTY